MELLKPKLCVIGAGPAGLDAAMGAAALGAAVVLVERGAMGGRWLTGAIATACLNAAARRAHAARNAAGLGVTAEVKAVDFARLREHARTVAANAAQNFRRERLAGLGIRVIEGTAQFTGRRIVTVGDAFTIRAKRFVVATGAGSALPAIAGLETVPHLTEDTLLDLREIPRHLVVVGSAPHALVIAQAFHSFGSAVTLLAGTDLLAGEDPECVRILTDQLARDGLVIRNGVTVARVEAAPDGIRVVVADAKGESEVVGSHLFVASAWRPATEGLGLEAARIKLNGQGLKGQGLKGGSPDGAGIVVDPWLRTSNRRVYAVGDVIGARPSVQAARHQAGVVVRNAVFRRTTYFDQGLAPRVVPTEPALAHVGLDAEAARQSGRQIRILRWPYRENDRAQAERDIHGHIKVLTDARGQVLGATIVGRDAAELIMPWSVAVSQGLDIRAFASAIVPFSTLAEVGNRAAMTYFAVDLTHRFGRRIMAWLRRSG